MKGKRKNEKRKTDKQYCRKNKTTGSLLFNQHSENTNGSLPFSEHIYKTTSILLFSAHNDKTSGSL